MHSPQRSVVRHPAVLTALLHGTFAAAFAVAVCLASLATLSGLPQLIAPILLACSTIVSMTVMVSGLLAVRRADAAHRVAAGGGDAG